MTMKRIRATREVYYASKTRHTGDEFDAHESDAKLLVGIDKAVYVEGDAPKVQPKQVLENRSMSAESAPVQQTAEKLPDPQPMTTENSEPVRRGRRYPRRDMQAKE